MGADSLEDFSTMKDFLVPVSVENDLREMMKRHLPVPHRKKKKNTNLVTGIVAARELDTLNVKQLINHDLQNDTE